MALSLVRKEGVREIFMWEKNWTVSYYGRGSQIQAYFPTLLEVSLAGCHSVFNLLRLENKQLHILYVTEKISNSNDT